MENNLPKTREQKIQFIKRMLSGQLTIEDVQESGYTVSLWKECEGEPDYLENIADKNIKVSRADFEARKALNNKNSLFVTLNID